MADIHELLDRLLASGAESLALVPGRPPTLLGGEAPEPLDDEALGRERIRALVEDLAASDGATEPTAAGGGRRTFRYRGDRGEVKVLLEDSSATVRAMIQKAGAGEPAVPPSPETGEPASSGSGERTETAGAGSSGSAAPGQEAPGGGGDSPGSSATSSEKRAGAASEGAEALERLLRELVDRGGSDLHVSAGEVPYYRKDGEMEVLEETSALPPERTREMVLSIAPEKARDEFEATNDVDFAHEIPGVARFRCNVFRDRKGVGGVFRQIPSDIWTAEDLGLPDVVLRFCELPKGLVVVTGPTGSGKSTTLAAMIDYINKNRKDHIITIEDPIEFTHDNQRCLVNQREVGPHTEGFKVALRAALREDPDIVLIGEMRDLETVEIALETAETGHLVFGTLHTNTAPSTVSRVIEQFPAEQQNHIRAMLSESLKGVIAQTLCRRKEGGRVAAQEILVVNDAVANLIREGKSFQIPSVMQTSGGLGMKTLNDALAELVQQGTVAPEEAYRNAVDKEEFEKLLERRGYSVSADEAAAMA